MSRLTGMKGLVRSAAVAAALVVSASAAIADPVRIAIANFGEHPDLARTIQGFKAGLAANGFVEGKDVVYDESHTNFDRTLVPQMLAKLLAAKPKLLFTITTPVSQAARVSLKNTNIPQVFAAVTDPVAAGLVPDWKKGGPGITGASDLQNGGAVMQLAKKVLPNAKTIGVPYNPGEANDVATVKFLETAATAEHLQLVSVGIDSVNDIPQRIASLRGKADIIYVPASNLLQPAAPAIASAAREAGIPVLAPDDASVKDGVAVATTSVNYMQVGENAGKIAAQILKGTDPATIPVSVPTLEEHKTFASKKAFKAFKMEIPAALKDCNCFVD